MNANQVIAVNFTYAITGGMWLEFADGEKSWWSFGQIEREFGKAEAERLTKIAFKDCFTGTWRKVV